MKLLQLTFIVGIFLLTACSSKEIIVDSNISSGPKFVETNVGVFDDIIISPITLSYKDMNYDMKYTLTKCESCENYVLASFCEDINREKYYFSSVPSSKISTVTMIVPNPRSRLNLTTGETLRCGVAVFSCLEIKELLNEDSCILKSREYYQFTSLKEFVGETIVQ